MATDCNEVQAALRVSQDAGFLQEMADLCLEKAAKLQTPKGGKDDKKALKGQSPYVQESIHTGGGDRQAPMTGPCAAVPGNGSAEEQCEVNNALLDEQLAEDRHTDKAAVQTVTTVGEPKGGGKKTKADPKPKAKPKATPTAAKSKDDATKEEPKE